MPDIFTSLLAIQFPDSFGAKSPKVDRQPGLTPGVKDGVWSERSNAAGGKSPIQGHYLDTDTVAIWRLDEVSEGPTVAEVKGAYPLSVFGNTTIVSGQIGNCRSFPDDGLSFLQGTANAALQAVMRGSFTFEAWIRGTYPDMKRLFSVQSSIIGTELEADNVLFILSVSGAARMNLLWESGAGVDTVVNQTVGSIPTGVFAHIAVTCENTSPTLRTVRFYINGVLQQTVAGVTPPDGGTSVNKVTIGASSVGVAGDDWLGEVDDVRLSGTVHNAEQILMSYKRGLGDL